MLGEESVWALAIPGMAAAVLWRLGAGRTWAVRAHEKLKQKKSRGVHGKWWMLLLLCAFFLGFFRMGQKALDWHALEAGLPAEEAVVSFQGRVLDIREKEFYYGVTVKTKDWGRVLVYVEKEKREEPEALTEISIRQLVTVRGEVSCFYLARNPGQFDLRGYYRAQGISMAVFADQITGQGEGSPYFDGLYRFRRGCSRILQEICEREDAGIFRAALLGEREGMDPVVRDLYQRSGIAHLLAISGLHVSLIGMSLHRLLRRAGLGYGGAGLLSGLLVLSYGMMTGGGGSLTRAMVMLFVSFLAGYLGRTYDLLSALSLAAILAAWAQPFQIGQAGFQLSFGALLGIGWLGERLNRSLGVKHGWQQTLITSLSIQLITGPVILWHYFQYPIYGIALNLLVIPLMGYVILSGILGVGMGFLVPALGVAAVGSGHYILWWYQRLCMLFQHLPGNQAVLGRPSWGQIGCYYLILGGTVWLVQRGAGQDHEPGGRWNIARLRLAGGMAASILCLHPLPQRGCDITMLDVGQGDGFVIQCEKPGGGLRSRAVVLIDGGSSSEKAMGKDRLAPYLKSQGIQEIDAAIVSHGDSDHISGLKYLLEEEEDIHIRCLVLPGKGVGDEAYDPLLAAAERRDTRVEYMETGDGLQAGACRFTCLYPGREDLVDPGDRNQQSLILRMDYEEFHMLFTGDADLEGELGAIHGYEKHGKDSYGGEGIALQEIQVLKAAHHGSRFSNSEELLEAVKPELVLISYGEENSYGHPHKEAMERFRMAGCQVLETGKLGAVMLHVEKGKVSYKGMLPVNQCR